LDTFPRLYRFFDSDRSTADRELLIDGKVHKVQSKLDRTMNAARQIFAVAVESVQQMSAIVRDKLAPQVDKKEYE
jgi:hypothetical protein